MLDTKNGQKRKPTQAANTGSSTSNELPRVLCRSSSALALVVSSFLRRFFNSTTRFPSDTWERSGGSVTKESCEAAGEKVLEVPKLPKDEEVAALLLRAGARFFDMDKTLRW